jgi:uncharacterized lipoprotein YddW (UPF0748 family)
MRKVALVFFLMRPLAALGILLLLHAPLGATAIDAVGYADDAALAKAWKPGNADSAAPALRSAEGSKYARFELPYSKLKDWRFSWDLQGHWDLERAERIVLKMRTGAAAAPGQGLVYFHSGEGWYSLPAFSVGPQWREISLDKSQAKKEDKPGDWSQVDAMRLSFMPGQGGDSSADLARVEGQGALPEKWVWQVGGAKDKEQCIARILNRAGGQAYTDARHRLSSADGILSHARADGLGGDERKDALYAARAKVAEAYALSQAPLKPGFRGAWVHNGDGPRGPDGQRGARWKDAIPEMHALGLNAVFPNLLWSGVAFYPSKVVPNAPSVAAEGDYLQEILDAAKPLGMQVHVWKVMWQFAEGWLAPVGVSQPFKDAGRMQKDVHGKESAWLCPCDDRNRKYELDALLEVAKYPIDGVHLDYIRFESPEAGFGDACKHRFEAWSGKTVEHWPADCAPGALYGDLYGDFKRELISSFVQEASQVLRAAKPGIKLSAAVFSYPELARKQVFQDWPRWVKEGWVDFVCPMTYTEDAASFEGASKAQAAIVGADKLRPGIQVVFDQGRAIPLESLVDQLKAADKLGAPGPTLFEWREGLLDRTLPYIRAGLWREGKYALKLSPEAEAPKKGPEVTPGARLKPKGKGKQARLAIDDFEDGDLVNALGGSWWTGADNNHLGTVLLDQPLRVSETARGKVLGLRGHFGKNQAPWPSAFLSTAFNQGSQPVDLRAFKKLCFWARGDGGPLDVYLRRAVVKDYADYRFSVQPGAEWQHYELALRDFAQPSWAQAVPKGFADTTYLQFQPGGRDDADFWFQIDDVELR